MTYSVFDFETIAKHARLKALDGTPQNVVQPMGVETAPVEFDGYGMYAGCADTAPSEVNPQPDWYALQGMANNHGKAIGSGGLQGSALLRGLGNQLGQAGRQSLAGNLGHQRGLGGLYSSGLDALYRSPEQDPA